MVLFLGLLPGCAGDIEPVGDGLETESIFEDEEYTVEDDPVIEEFNRIMFEFNLFLDDYFFSPAAKVAKTLLPDAALKAMYNFTYNLYSPFSAVNHLLQWRLHEMCEDVAAFMINTTLGVGGVLPVASDLGVYPKYTDFGVTLARWGVPNGPMIMFPFLGPMYPNDIVGSLFKQVLDPVTYALNRFDLSEWQMPLLSLELLTLRIAQGDQIDFARENAFDFYTTFKVMYDQRREALINN